MNSKKRILELEKYGIVEKGDKVRPLTQGGRALRKERKPAGGGSRKKKRATWREEPAEIVEAR